MSADEEARKKQEYLTKLRRLENDGLRGQRMTMQNSLAEIKAEYDNLTDSKNLEASIRFQRNALMTFVSGVEMVNDKFGNKLPVDLGAAQDRLEVVVWIWAWVLLQWVWVLRLLRLLARPQAVAHPLTLPVQHHQKGLVSVARCAVPSVWMTSLKPSRPSVLCRPPVAHPSPPLMQVSLQQMAHLRHQRVECLFCERESVA